MDIDLRHYRYFVALAEELHFARAAERLGISQPALSQQIRAMEQGLGASLLSRTKRHVELTGVGQVFYEQAQTVLRQVEHARQATAEAALGDTGMVSMAYVASAALSGVLPSIVYRFRQERPAVELVVQEMEMSQQLSSVSKGLFDVGFVRPPIGELPDGLSKFDLLLEPVVVALRATHALARQARINPADLRDDTFICTHKKEGIGFYEITASICRRAGFVPRVEVLSPQMSVIISMVAAGFGVALVPSSTQSFAPSDVVFRPLVNNDVKSALSIVYRYNERSPAVRAFVEAARSWARRPRSAK